MTVTARCYGTLRKTASEETNLHLGEGSTALDLLNALDLKKKEIGIILINGKNKPVSSTLQDKDIVSFFNFMCGG